MARRSFFPKMLAAVCALAPILSATLAGAVEVRQPETGAVFDATLVRAYAECTAPDTVARNGAPACTAMSTSSCIPGGARFALTPPANLFFDPDPTVPDGVAPVSGNGHSALCRNGDYTFVFRIRTTTGVSLEEDPDNPGIPSACPSQRCTFPDQTISSALGESIADANGEVDPDYEILGATFTGPDGLPLATIGMARNLQTFITSNLTVPYPPCTAPGPGGACDLVPPTVGCDFEVGTVEWSLGYYGLPQAHVVLRDLAGSSPLCTNGTYKLQATLRVNGQACGDAFDQVLCTVSDQTITTPFVVAGRSADTTVTFPMGPLGKYIETTIDNIGLLDFRLIDPTGATIGVPGVTGVRSLVKPRVDVKGDRVRVRATIPVNALAPTIDPTLEGGATVTLGDPTGGPFYAVTIPETRWQDQSPIGSRWTYDDPGGVLGGVRKAKIKRLGHAGANKGYALDLRAEGLDLSGLDFPSITVAISVQRPYDPNFGFSTEHRAQGHCTGVFKGPRLSCK